MVAVFTVSCGKDNGIESPTGPGQVDYLKGFVGGVAADEPRAALVARNILSAGGSAADAVVAGALAYSVTYPSAASLGSGGFCVASDTVRKAESIEFPAIAPADGGPIAIPGMVRGLSLLHARYGRLRWEAVVTPAEQLARFGEPASRAFVQAAVEAQPPVTQSPALMPVYGTRTGQVPQEGERRYQPGIGNVLARIRINGANELYTQILPAEMRAAGSSVTAEELAKYTATTSKPIEVPFENSMTIYTSNNGSGGAVAAWLIEQAYDGGSFFRRSNLFSGDGTDNVKFAESIGQAYRGDPATMQLNGFGSASITAIDSRGGAVACAFSMGPAFGSRVVGRQTGILFAAPPGAAGDETPYLTAMVGFNGKINQSYIAAAGAGGAPSAAATAYSVLQAALGKVKVDPAAPALAMPRLFQANPQSTLLVEPKTDPAIYKGIAARGVTVNEIGRLGRVNLAYCSEGLPRAPESCSFASDPRTYGLAVGRQH